MSARTTFGRRQNRTKLVPTWLFVTEGFKLSTFSVDKSGDNSADKRKDS